MMRRSFKNFSGWAWAALIFLSCASAPRPSEGNFAAPRPASQSQADLSDALRFKREYEDLNGTKRADGAVLRPVEIPADNTFRYLTGEEALEFSRQGTGVVFLGAGWCRWCRSIAPEYARMAGEYLSYNTIYYVPLKNEDGEKNRAYRALAELVGDYMQKAGSSFANVSGNPLVTASYVKRNRDEGYGLYPAITLFFNRGTLVGMHVGTVPDHNDSNKPLDAAGIKSLEEAFKKHFEVLGTDPCPAKC
jgi:thiol-disulfide isomerase/thioredoxin